MTGKWNARNHITRSGNGKNSPSKIVIDITKCNKRACIFKKQKKRNKVDSLKGLEIQNHPYYGNYT